MDTRLTFFIQTQAFIGTQYAVVRGNNMRHLSPGCHGQSNFINFDLMFDFKPAVSFSILFTFNPIRLFLQGIN